MPKSDSERVTDHMVRKIFTTVANRSNTRWIILKWACLSLGALILIAMISYRVGYDAAASLCVGGPV